MKQSAPFFSVVIPTFNRPVELKRAVSSVLNQTFDDYEVVIVNNGSIPVSTEYDQGEKIRLVKEDRKGGNYARNTGVDLAKGSYICFLDDDDEYLDHHLERLYSLIQTHNNQPGLYKTLTRLEVSSGKFEDQEFEPCPNQESRMEYAMTYLIFMASVCLPKDIALKHRFDPEIKVAQDYHLWLRILAEYPMFESASVTTVYHRTGTSVSSPGLEKYLQYIDVHKSLFKIKAIGSKISGSRKRDRLYRYHFWILADYADKLSWKNFYKILAAAIRYKPGFIFSSMPYKAILKNFFSPKAVGNDPGLKTHSP